MERRSHDCGNGTVLTVGSDEDLRALVPDLRELVSPRLVELWRDPRRTLRALAKKAKGVAVRRWLETVANARCSLEIYDLEMPPVRSAYLRLDVGDWTVLVDGKTTGIPRGCPAPLRDAYSLIGGLCTQVGAAHFLVAPAKLQPASRMGEIRGRLEPPDVGDMSQVLEGRFPDPRKLFADANRKAAEAASGVEWWRPLNLDFDPSAYVPFFCSGGGDWLCYAAGKGSARWIGYEDGSESETTVEAAVESLFTALANQEYFGDRS